MYWIFLAFLVMGLFGSLMRFTPRLPWNDFTFLFRKERKAEYLAFANHFTANYWLGVAGVSLIGFLVTFLMGVKEDGRVLLIIFAVYCASGVIAGIAQEVLWRRR